MNTQIAYAIVEAGGNQHRVKVGQRRKLGKIDGEPGQSVELGKVLMLADGDNVQIGTPYLSSVVVAKIIQHGRGEKVTIIKMRRRKTYRRKQGHRQDFTEVEITSI